MATNLETKIQRIQSNVTAALAKIAEKGVTVPGGSTSDDLEGLISQLKDLNYETWTFELEDGNSVEKVVYVG